MPGIESFLDRYIPDAGDTALDVGANHGVWSRYLADRFAKVYAIEPNPALWAALDDLAPNVELVSMGAWFRYVWRTFTVYAHDANTSTADNWQGIKAGAPESSFNVICAPIDKMIISGRVDFIKIDAEAAEVEVVRGAAATIQRDRPRLIIEVHTAAAGAALAALFAPWRYTLTMVRHPYYTADSPWWDEHYWLICEPNT